MSQRPSLEGARRPSMDKRTSIDGPKLERQATILRLPSEKQPDIFDHEDFNAIKFINQIYPDESSLSDLDRFIAVLRTQVAAVDKDIFQAVRAQGGAHTRARQDLAAAHQQIEDLFTKIQEIQRKSEESEAMVQEICRDIKKLDYAKKHLTNAITSLRRLAMLTAAVAELEGVAGKRDQYRKCANLLEAVHQLMEYFQQYEAIPKVKTLTKRLQSVQSLLQDNVIDDFKILMGAADIKLTPDNLDRLANACLVIDALGPKVRDQLMDWLCDREMKIYQSIFQPGAEGSKLDRFERRYMWFKARLEEKKESWSVFPENWRVPQMLCLTFCKITKTQLKALLHDDEAAMKEDIGNLIKTVVATNKFEKEMAATFGGGSMEEEEEDVGSTDNMSASEARRRLEKYRHKVKVEEHRKAIEMAGDKAREALEAAKMAFEGAISEAFEDSLKMYVAEEEKELMNYLDTVLREEHEHRWQPAEDDVSSVKVLQSANKLFFKIRTSLTRCSKMINKGNTLLSLTHIFQKALSIYSSELMKRLPKTAMGTTNANPTSSSTDWHIRMSDDDEKVVCYILHTAEFCRETIEGLSAAVHKDIKPALVDKVDFSEEENLFMSVASACLSVLVLGINTRLDAAVRELASTRWDAIEQPGDDSTFVNTVRKVMLDSAPRLGSELDRVNFTFLCEKMSRMFVPRVHESIYKIRKISEKGTLQLSIDADAIKRILVDFPKVARPHDDDLDMPNYTSYVEREMGAVINLVKVLQSKPENLVDTYLLLMPADSQSLMEFARVCEIKGLARKQQQDLMAFYTQKTQGGASLSSVSEPSPSLPTPASAAASNLGAFKLNINSFTRELASTLNFPTKAQAAGEPSPANAASTAKPSIFSRPGGGSPAHTRTGSSTDAATFFSGAAGKAKEGFAKIGNFMKLGGDNALQDNQPR